jgi:hypothetical protein
MATATITSVCRSRASRTAARSLCAHKFVAAKRHAVHRRVAQQTGHHLAMMMQIAGPGQRIFREAQRLRGGTVLKLRLGERAGGDHDVAVVGAVLK